MALWIDFVWKTIPVSQSFSLFLASGLDIENHTLTFGARQKSDTDGTDNSLASLTSKMTALSLRLRSGFDFKIAGPLAITSGLTVMAPITKFGATTSAAVDDPHAADKTNSADNLKAAVAHKKALAIGLEIGANLVF